MKKDLLYPAEVKRKYFDEILSNILRLNPSINISGITKFIEMIGNEEEGFASAQNQYEAVMAILIHQIINLRYKLETRTKNE